MKSLAPVLLLLAACSSGPAEAPPADPSGVYVLQRVDGQPLPCKILHGDAKLELRSGTFTFRPDGTCATVTVFARVGGAELRREANATWTREGGKFWMNWERAGRTTGVLDGGAFTMINEGLEWEYRK